MRRVERHITTVPAHHPPVQDDAGIVFEEYLLRRAVRDSVEAEQRLSAAIAMAVAAGFSRDTIGMILGVGRTGEENRLDQAS